MHGAPGGPTSSGLYDAATDAFRRWRDDDESALDELVRVMSPVLWHVVRATGLDKEAVRGRRPEHLADAGPLRRLRPRPAGHHPLAVHGRPPRGLAREQGRRPAPARSRTRCSTRGCRPRPRPSPRSSPTTRTPASGTRSAGCPERCQKLLRIVAWEPRPDYSSVADDPRHADRQHRPHAPSLPREAPGRAGRCVVTRTDDAAPRRDRGALRRLRPRSRRPRRRRARPAGGRGPRGRSTSCSPSSSASTTPPAPAAPEVAAAQDEATVALEFAGTSYRVLVRISTVDGHRRLDGWVVPARPMRVFLGPQGDALAHTRQSAESDARRPLRVPDAGDRRGPALADAAGRGRARTLPSRPSSPRCSCSEGRLEASGKYFRPGGISTVPSRS